MNISRISIALTLILFLGITLVKAQQTIFTGTWNLNAMKTDFGGIAPAQATASVIKLTQAKDAVTFERTFLGIPVSTEILKTNGELLQVNLPGIQKFTHLQWSDDGKTLKVLSNYKAEKGPDGNPWEYNRTEIYSLSPDGSVLNLLRVTVTPDRADTIKAVYDKQQ